MLCATLPAAVIADDDPKTAQELREQGAFEVVVSLMREHRDNDTLMTASGGFIAACSVGFNDDWTELLNFETPIPENQAFFLANGATELIIEVWKACGAGVDPPLHLPSRLRSSRPSGLSSDLRLLNGP